MADRVASLVDEIALHATEPLRSEVETVRAALGETLRVAVVGRLKAGKSTLVNALLGQRVAPTDVSECTRMVTVFRFGHPERVQVMLRDGGSRDVPLVDGVVPLSVGAGPAEVAALHVWLTNDSLRSMTLIDTPGLASLDAERSGATEELLAAEHASSTAAAAADAIVLVINQTPRDDDMEALRRFRDGGGGAQRTAVNAIGLLTKADLVGGGGPGAWEAAGKLATRYSQRFREDMAVVVPVVGLVAETTGCARLTEDDATTVATLAALPAEDRARLLWSADRFVGLPAPVPAPARARLLDLLSLFGVERALLAHERGAQGAFALRAELARDSGIDAVRQALHVTFRRRSDALKAWQALASLESLSYRPEAGVLAAAIRDRIEQLRLDPEMHELAELEAVLAVRRGDVDLPEESIAEVERLVSADGDAARLGLADATATSIRAGAVQAVARWRQFILNGADPRQEQLARVMIRSYTLMFERLEVQPR
jgi:hypothetical protein